MERGKLQENTKMPQVHKISGCKWNGRYLYLQLFLPRDTLWDVHDCHAAGLERNRIRRRGWNMRNVLVVSFFSTHEWLMCFTCAETLCGKRQGFPWENVNCARDRKFWLNYKIQILTDNHYKSSYGPDRNECSSCEVWKKFPPLIKRFK